MNEVAILSFPEWVLQNKNKIFRYLIYKKMFTPYEQQKAFEDESEFTDYHFSTGRIVEVATLLDNDYLLGFLRVDPEFPEDTEDPDYKEYIEYHKLSDIKLEYYQGDQIVTDENRSYEKN